MDGDVRWPTDEPHHGRRDGSADVYEPAQRELRVSIPDISGWHQGDLAYSGYLTVNGTALSESLTYTQVVYAVNVTESGLLSGLSWTVSVGGNPMTLTTDGGTDTLGFSSLPNGTYAVAIADIVGWYQNDVPYTGSTLTVNGGATSLSIVYTQAVFPVPSRRRGFRAD